MANVFSRDSDFIVNITISVARRSSGELKSYCFKVRIGGAGVRSAERRAGIGPGTRVCPAALLQATGGRQGATACQLEGLLLLADDGQMRTGAHNRESGEISRSRLGFCIPGRTSSHLERIMVVLRRSIQEGIE